MGAATDGVPFPVIFFDGEQETEIGNVFIHASLSFKNFQSILSNRIGISPHQISIYLVDRKRSRKIPITRKVDFAAFLHGTDCVFFAVLKRSRRERRRRDGYGFGFDRGKKTPPARVMLLRRNEGVDGDRPISVLLPLAEYEGRGRRLKMERRLEMERERLLLEMGLSDLRLDREDTTTRRVSVGNGGGVGGGLVVCEECLRAENTGMDPGFHWCVYDTVTVGFRSPAGPIARPGEESG